MSADKTGASGTLLRRFHALGAGLTAGELSRVDCAVLFWLLEYAGGDRLETWPALITLASASGLSRRQVSRSIERLRRLGYIVIVSSGTRAGRSTLHRLTEKGAGDILTGKQKASERWQVDAAGGADKSDTTGTDSSDTTVLTIQVEGTDRTVPDVVTGLSHKPPMNRAMKRGSMDVVVEVDLPAAAPPSASTAAVAAGSPGGSQPSAARRPGQLVHSWFWDAYPKRDRAAEADRHLDDLLSRGIDQSDIECGVRAYAEHVRRKRLEARYIAAPLNWLRQERWADRYDDADPAERTEAKPQKTLGRASKRAQEARSARTKGASAAKPLSAAKSRSAETPDERAARLAAEKAKKAQRAADREAAEQRRAEKLRADLEEAAANRDAVVSELTEAGIPRENIHKWTATVLLRKGYITHDIYQNQKYSLALALGYDVKKAEPTDQYTFLSWFGKRGVRRFVPKIVQYFQEAQEKLRKQEQAKAESERASEQAGR